MEAHGNVISTESTIPVSGDILELWTFLVRFRELLGVQKCFSLEELITELNRPSFDGLSEAHILMLQVLISEFPEKHIVKCSAKSTKTKLNMPPVNDFTWPELARRYILAMLMTQDPKCEIMDIFRILYGDGGPKCGALTGLVGLEADASLLAASTNKIYGSLYVDGDKLGCDEKDMRQRTMSNESDPGWVQVLDPIKDLKTNNGSRIRNCINNSLEMDPPEWARELLEHSVSKGFYKGNASGPTKKLALNVVAEFHSKQQNLTLTGNKKNIPISNIVMKHCRIMLRRASASKETKRFCKLLKKNMVKRGNNNIGILWSPAEVWSLLYFRMIDMRLAAGAYSGSHKAFFEDVQEFWRAVHIEFGNYPTLIEFATQASHVFESLYIKEVVTLHRELEEYSYSKSLSACILQDNDYDIICANKIPKAPWDEGVCKVCGTDKDNGNVLLCDECNAEYHTYCLNPPLLGIPKENWFCPCCVANNHVEDVSLHATTFAEQLEMKTNGEFVSLILSKMDALETMIRGKEKWELSFQERTLLLKFFCDEMLDSSHLHNDFKDSNDVKGSSQIAAYLGHNFKDSTSKLYWTVDFGTKPCIIINYTNWLNQSSSTVQELFKNYMSGEINLLSHKGSEVYSTWSCSRSRVGMQDVVKFFKDKTKENDEDNIKELENFTLSDKDVEKFYLCDDVVMQDPNELQSISMSLDNLKVKAAKVLELKYGSFVKMKTTDYLKKNRDKEVAGNLCRCECLELILPAGDHCFSCHKTFCTTTDYVLHVKGRCNITNSKMSTSFGGISNSMVSNGKEKVITCLQDSCAHPNKLIDKISGVDERRRLEQLEGLVIDNLFNVPAASVSPLIGRASEILTRLKLNLLDMEAAIPRDALKPSRTCIDKKWAWRSFLKHASTIYEMVQALIVFEDMVKLEYLHSSWGFWSSLSAAANMSTLAALSLRIYSLDAAITYEEKFQPSSSPGLLGRANSGKGQCSLAPKRKPGRKRKSQSEE